MVLFILIIKDHKTGLVKACLFFFFFILCLFFSFCLLFKQKMNSIKQTCYVRDHCLDTGPFAVFPIELPASISRCPFDQHRALCCRCPALVPMTPLHHILFRTHDFLQPKVCIGVCMCLSRVCAVLAQNLRSRF